VAAPGGGAPPDTADAGTFPVSAGGRSPWLTQMQALQLTL
jgi:hypothetical protein